MYSKYVCMNVCMYEWMYVCLKMGDLILRMLQMRIIDRTVWQGDGGSRCDRRNPHLWGEELSERGVGPAHRAVRGAAAVGAIGDNEIEIEISFHYWFTIAVLLLRFI